MIIIICDYCKKKVEAVTEIKQGDLIVKFYAIPYQGHSAFITEQQTPVIHTDRHHMCPDCLTQLTELLTRAVKYETEKILRDLSKNDG